jgi:hypothetical protein
MQSRWHWFGAFSAHLGSYFFGVGTPHCLAGPLFKKVAFGLAAFDLHGAVVNVAAKKKIKICNFLCSKSHLWISLGCLHILQPSWGLLLWHSVSRLSATGR